MTNKSATRKQNNDPEQHKGDPVCKNSLYITVLSKYNYTLPLISKCGKQRAYLKSCSAILRQLKTKAYLKLPKMQNIRPTMIKVTDITFKFVTTPQLAAVAQ